MKIPVIVCICSITLTTGSFAQAPTASPTPSATATESVTASGSPSDLADRIHQKLEKKFRSQHGITIEGGNHDEDDDLRKMRDAVAIPIVASVLTQLSGA